MADFTNVKKNLEARGFAVTAFATKEEAAAYLNGAIDGVSVGIGGSATVQEMGLYDMLASHNEMHWHWVNGPEERKSAMQTQVYLSQRPGGDRRDHQHRRLLQPGGRHAVRPREGVFHCGPQQAGAHL